MKTNAISFLKCNPQGDELFSVRADIPAADALSEASCLLDAAAGLLADATSHESYSAWLLIKMAKAAIDALEVDRV